MTATQLQKVPRESGLELYRIIGMILIVAHHYVVNSGLLELMYQEPLCGKSIFLFLFGMWGKTGINCFVLITGYFMCTSRITLRKFLKLLMMVYFYRIIIYTLFIISGHQALNASGIIKVLLPITSVAQDFVGCYLLFYLTIPFLNILIGGMNKKQHFLAMCLALFIYTFLGSIPKIHVDMNYVSWFIVLYLIGSYLRLYPEKWSSNKKIWMYGTLITISLAVASVIGFAGLSEWISNMLNQDYRLEYFLVSDSNKILAVAVAVCSFMLFKNLGIKYSKAINTVASATFGVLLIHANSDTMRQWLWAETLNNVGWYTAEIGDGGTFTVILHAFLCVFVVYSACTIIEYLRLRFAEKSLLDVAERAADRIKKNFYVTWKTNR